MSRKKYKINNTVKVMSFILIVLVVVAIVIFRQDNSLTKKIATQDDVETAIGETSIQFPYDLGEGLIVESLFQFTGMNPDCDNMEGENIIAIVVENKSDRYLANAAITMRSIEGEDVHFTVTNLPVNKKTMAFSSENMSSDNEMACDDMICEAMFDEKATMSDDKISVFVNGTLVTLQSNVDEEMNNIVLYCRSVLDDQYFGGTTYTYTVDKLPAYGTVELDAKDCILGLAEVVRIDINQP